MRRAFALIFAIAVTLALAPAAGSKTVYPYFSPTIPLIVDESLPGFIPPQANLQLPKGIAKFTTIVPSSAKGMHGIGIDGGPYRDIRGAYVKPGYSSSLTVGLLPGDYTVFDSYKKNRRAGYFLKVHVTHASAKHASYGTRCPLGQDFDIFTTIWAVKVGCSSANDLVDSVEAQWHKNNFAYTPITVREFNCFINPVSAIGLKFACIAGDARVTWTG
jgi:hypothetical protein